MAEPPQQHSEQKAAGMHAGAGDVPPEARLLSVFGNALLPPRSLADVSPRSLAHLGDAVFHLFEREREIAHISSAKQMHTRARVNAAMQADLLDRLMPQLRERELDIVRRARNVKVSQARRADQAIYRLSTAFEALLGYLYLTDLGRLKDVLALTIQDAPPEGSPPDEKTTIKP